MDTVDCGAVVWWWWQEVGRGVTPQFGDSTSKHPVWLKMDVTDHFGESSSISSVCHQLAALGLFPLSLVVPCLTKGQHDDLITLSCERNWKDNPTPFPTQASVLIWGSWRRSVSMRKERVSRGAVGLTPPLLSLKNNFYFRFLTPKMQNVTRRKGNTANTMLFSLILWLGAIQRRSLDTRVSPEIQCDNLS